ncbi:heme uptake protein IsdC [Gracilibacillus suaedae]|uniref:heme uptake protein IsdC n=1 Tax=Gracilibacillus suaedae TaxID=2820273 RepID=UPI001ABE589B|nr:heme uptake protein IsdC [Gracilibacillus suaedae]
MIRKLPFLVIIVGVFCFIFVQPLTAATDLENGTYTMDYTVLHADNDSASMANDYWEKPATIIAKDGKLTVQMTINHSAWVTEFKTPNNGGYADVAVISTDEEADKRTVQFSADDLSSPMSAKIHVTVPDIDYDHDYTIRFSFDESSMQTIETEASADQNTSEQEQSTSSEEEQSNNNSTTTSTEQEDNPKTSDMAMIPLFVFLLIGSMFMLWRQWRTQ